MSVKSEPLGGTRKPSAIVTRAQLARSRGTFERVSAGLVLLASYIGTVWALAGGVTAWLEAPGRPLPWVAALMTQALLTALQWWYGSLRRTHPAYLVALAVDAATTTLGYGPLLTPYVAVWLVPWAGDAALSGAWLTLAAGALIVAWYPESRFVD